MAEHLRILSTTRNPPWPDRSLASLGLNAKKISVVVKQGVGSWKCTALQNLTLLPFGFINASEKGWVILTAV